MVDEQYRGLLTDREKEILSGEDEVSKSYQSRVKTRVRNKIQKISSDSKILKNNQPELYDELIACICDE